MSYSAIPSANGGSHHGMNGANGGSHHGMNGANGGSHHGTNGFAADERSPDERSWRKPAVLCIAALGIVGAAVGTVIDSRRHAKATPQKPVLLPSTVNGKVQDLPMPHGVNLAAWLSLEDYFFVGNSGAIEVATPDDVTVAQCLPPLHVGQGPKWQSETDLFANLAKMEGGIRSAIKTFHAFRVSYLDWDEELSRITQLGIHRVRVPISWCLTDHDPSDDDILGRDETDDDSGASDAILEERYTCKDPFFEQTNDDDDVVLWPAIPRPFLARFLRACNKHGLKVTLDIHTYAGGTSIGTFSGVWPRKPLFWKFDDPANPEEDKGRRIFHEFLDWIEWLGENDPDAFAAIKAITPMNEPGHLAGIFGPGSDNPDVDSFLPSLPTDIAQGFLSDLGRGADSPSYLPIPDGPHLRILLWQRDAVSAFRSTSLPQRGIELHVNLHESILVSSLVTDDLEDPGGRHPHATGILASWWRGTTSQEERATWAVLDMHHYHAWEPFCQGAVDGPPMGNYTCGDVEATDDALRRCGSWASKYREVVNEQLGGDTAKLASGEFSASTHHLVLHSCLDTTTIRKSYLAQVVAASEAGVELFWWSWKMPYGGAFRRAWSFKSFLNAAGVEGFTSPDESLVMCGE